MAGLALKIKAASNRALKPAPAPVVPSKPAASKPALAVKPAKGQKLKLNKNSASPASSKPAADDKPAAAAAPGKKVVYRGSRKGKYRTPRPVVVDA